jgi:hypothetical protein
MKANRVIVGATFYVVISCDKVFTIDNQSRLSINCYAMYNYVRIPKFISLNWVLEGFGCDNLINVIMEALMIGGGLPRNQIV